MSHAGSGGGCCRDGATRVASVSADGAFAADADAEGAGASALVVPVRNGRSNASLSRETFLGPKPGSRAICAASACAILAKLWVFVRVCPCPCQWHAGIYRERKSVRRGL